MAEVRAAIYSRFSSGGQDSATLENQESQCKAEIEKAGHTLFRVYSDAAKSAAPGKSEKRHDFNQMLADAGKKDFEYLYLYSSSRLSRDYGADVLILVQTMNKAGVKVRVITQEHLPEDILESDFGDILWLMSAKENNFYIINLQRAVTDGMIQALKAGYWVNGATPYGYMRNKVLDQAHEKYRIRLVPNPSEAKVVKKVFELYLENISQKEIARRLEAIHIYPREYVRRNKDTRKRETRQTKHWAQPRIAEMLKNPIYSGSTTLTITRRKGDRVLSIESFDYKVDPIIPKELWLAVQAKRETQKRPEVKRSAQSPRPFSGLAKCGECGRPMVSNYMYKRIALVCASRKYVHQARNPDNYKCNNKQYLDENILVKHARQMLSMAFHSPERCRETFEKAKQSRGKEASDISKKLDSMKTEIARQEKIIAAYYREFEANPERNFPHERVDPLQRTLLKLREESKDLEAEKRSLPLIPENFREFSEWWKEKMLEIEKLEGADFRRALSEIGFRITSYADGRIEMGLVDWDTSPEEARYTIGPDLLPEQESPKSSPSRNTNNTLRPAQSHS